MSQAGDLKRHVQVVHEQSETTRFKCGICDKDFSRLSHLEFHKKSVHEKKYKCEQCDKQFSSVSYLKSHFRNVHSKIDEKSSENTIKKIRQKDHTALKSIGTFKNHLQLIDNEQNKDIKVKCQICTIDFKSSKNLRLHMKNLHDVKDKEPVKCHLCEFVLTCKSGLRSHIKLIHGEDKIKKCDVCEQDFSAKYLKVHFATEHEGHQKIRRKVPSKEVICKVCEKSFSNKKVVAFHIKTQHSNQCQLFKCNSCEKEFKTKGAMDRHVNSVHEKKLVFKCNVCNKMFSRNDQLTMHTLRMHNENDFECDFCEKSFASEGLLKTHVVRSHAEPKSQPPIECELCKKIFTIKSRFQKHLKLIHNEVMVFRCGLCQKSYNNRKSLASHINRIHEKKQLTNKYSCLTCQYSFVTQRHLEFHVQNIHSDPDTKNFECSECQKRYKYAYSLKLHFSAIHEIGKIECPHCNKFYSKKEVLKEHISTVHCKEKKFRCDPCQKSFTQWSGLKGHKESKAHLNTLKAP